MTKLLLRLRIILDREFLHQSGLHLSAWYFIAAVLVNKHLGLTVLNGLLARPLGGLLRHELDVRCAASEIGAAHSRRLLSKAYITAATPSEDSSRYSLIDRVLLHVIGLLSSSGVGFVEAHVDKHTAGVLVGAACRR